MGPMPIPPYTICYQPSSSGTILAGQHPSPAHSGTSSVHIGSYDPVLLTYQSLGNQTGHLLKGDNQHPMPRRHLHSKESPPWNILLTHVPTIGTSRRECLGRIPLARLVQRLVVEPCLVDSTLATHPKRTPRSLHVAITLLPYHRHHVP